MRRSPSGLLFVAAAFLSASLSALPATRGQLVIPPEPMPSLTANGPSTPPSQAPPGADAGVTPAQALMPVGEPASAAASLAPDDPAALDPPPPEPSWYQPAYWIDPDIWDGSIELGINGSDGNSETLNLNSGLDLSRETERHLWEFDINYAKNTSDGRETQHYAILNNRLEWKLTDSPWSLFTRTGIRYDEFQAFDFRLNSNVGLAYAFVDKKTLKMKGRFGAGVSHEFGSPDDRWVPEAALGFDYQQQITQRQKIKSTLDYFPAWEDFSDYRLVFDTGWEFLVDPESNLSFKVGVIDRYDSTPNGARPNDLFYTLLLLWKL